MSCRYWSLRQHWLQCRLERTYWVLVGDGTCWRNPVQATKMWRRVTLKEKRQQMACKHARLKDTCTNTAQALIGGGFQSIHSQWITHWSSQIWNRQMHSHTLSHTTQAWSHQEMSEDFVLQTNWLITGEDRGILVASNYLLHHAGRPDSTLHCYFFPSFFFFSF